jgi:nucleoside-triphosphatase THEP1
LEGRENMEMSAALAGLLYKILTDVAKITGSMLKVNESFSEERLRNHISDTERWSRSVQFLGMATALDTSEATIPLQISSNPRRFRRQGSQFKILSESEVVQSRGPTIILGDPGSGKTTTVKRIVRNLIIHEPSSDADRFDYPILLKVRELRRGETLIEAIAYLFGIEIREPTKVEKAQGNYTRNAERERLSCIQKFLSDASVMIVVDGLDEVELESRDALYRDLQQIGHVINAGNLIATCRSGDFLRNLEGFDVVEIMPLRDEDVAEIARRWSKYPSEFLCAVESVPYKPLLDRPLFLCQIILLFDEKRELPERPAQVYSQIVLLMIDKWDNQRAIIRPKLTRYGKMKSDQKLEVLASLAMELLYEKRKKVFDTQDIYNAITNVKDRFKIEPGDATDIVSEIESHTGIIFESSVGLYEFCHYSIQEYLCAHFLVRQPSLDRAVRNFERYSEPVAIAVCISSDPTVYFAHLMKALASRLKQLVPVDAIISFLHRLNLETSGMVDGTVYGAGVLSLVSCVSLTVSDQDTNFDWRQILAMLPEGGASSASIEAALQEYAVVAWHGPQFMRLQKKLDPSMDLEPFADVLVLPRDCERILGLSRVPTGGRTAF